MEEFPTLRAQLLESQHSEEGVDAELANLLLDLATAAKIISREVNKAALAGILGLTGTVNVHGEEVKKLDAFANELLIDTLRSRGSVCGMASEENEEMIAPSPKGEASSYVLFFDPLDGSSNIDVNVSIGTIFSIYRRKSACGAATMEDLLRCGTEQVAAGYFLYGSSTMLVYTVGRGVHGFTLDPSTGEFLLSHREIQTPARGKIFSCNEGNSAKWEEPTRRYVESLKNGATGPDRPYSGRYVGSFVADFHRNLLKGGIFLYPGQLSSPGSPAKGKLRLMYEGNPMAFVVEQAGGLATDGKRPLREILPKGIHDRVPLIIGSREDVEEYLRFQPS